MKQFFQKKTFNPADQTIVNHSVEIVLAYQRLGYKLTLRQLYYQLVSRNIVPNTEKSYNRVGVIISNARMAGLIDWEMIEDRNRHTIIPQHWESPSQIISACAHSYRIDKWLNQPAYCEVMVEKQALEGVLEPVCRELDIPFTSNKGYSSVTMMHAAGQKLKMEFRRRCQRKGLWNLEWNRAKRQNIACAQALAENKMLTDKFHLTEAAKKDGWPLIVVFYLGDHDPSGIDMSRDVADRLRTFSDYTPIEVRRLALNIQQVREINPPENPAKITDSRAKKYIERFGRSSWELDAVEPTMLANMVRNAVREIRDEKIWREDCELEAQQKKTLEGISKTLQKK